MEQLGGRACSRTTMEGYFLACSPLLAQLASVYNQSHLPGGGTAHNGLDLRTAIINQGNVLQTYPQTNLMEAISQLRLSLPK